MNVIGRAVELTSDENKVLAWLHQVSEAKVIANDVTMHFLAVMAANCITGTWTEATIGPELKEIVYTVHEADTFWKADTNVLGEGFASCITVQDNGELLVSDDNMRAAFGNFGMELFDRFMLITDSIGFAMRTMAANDNHDLNLLVRLQIFQPITAMVLPGYALDRVYVSQLLIKAIEEGQAVDKQFLSPRWKLAIELGDTLLMSLSLLLLHLEYRLATTSLGEREAPQ